MDTVGVRLDCQCGMRTIALTAVARRPTLIASCITYRERKHYFFVACVLARLTVRQRLCSIYAADCLLIITHLHSKSAGD